MAYKCKIISYITPEGKIEHEYKGKRNMSCGAKSVLPFDRADPIAEFITPQHEEAMKRLGLQRLETRLEIIN